MQIQNVTLLLQREWYSLTLKRWPPSPSPLNTLCSHAPHSPTRINIFQNTGLFRSCTLNPTGMFPSRSHGGERLTSLTVPHAAQLSDPPLKLSLQCTDHSSPSSIYFELIHFISLTHGGNIVQVCVMENGGSITPLADFRIKILH